MLSIPNTVDVKEEWNIEEIQSCLLFLWKSSYKSLKLPKVFLKNVSNTIHKYQVKHFEKLHASSLLLSVNPS